MSVNLNGLGLNSEMRNNVNVGVFVSISSEHRRAIFT